MAKSLSYLVCLAVFGFVGWVSASPLKPMPEESGVSGSIVAGVSSAKYSSNMISGPRGELGNKTVTSLDQAPRAETNTSPFFTGELTYTFAQSRTQIYFGSELEDLVRYDLSSQLGVRKQFENKTTLYGAFLFSVVPTKVYADPYVQNSPRVETDRDSSGFRIGAQNLIQTGIGVELSLRDIEVKDERSGSQLVSDGILSVAQQQLLSREGDHLDLKVNYVFPAAKEHILVPELSFESFDLNGKARSRNRISMKLSYFYISADWSFIASSYYATSDFDASNPIYGLTEEVDTFGGSAVATYNNLFGAEDLSLFASVAAASSDSNINFYDQEAMTGSFGVIYQF